MTTANHKDYSCKYMQNFGVRAVWSQEVVDAETGERVTRTRCVDLLMYGFGQGKWSEDYEGDVSVADRASCDAVAAALGIPADKIGTAVCAIVLAANVRGHGCLDWEALEVFHAGRSLVGGYFEDPERLYRQEDGEFGTWYGNSEDHLLVRLRGFGAVDAFPNIQGAQTHDGFERGAAFEPPKGDYRGQKNSPYRALKYAQEYSMALKPADFASLPALINAFRVTCTYKKPVYWRERFEANDWSRGSVIVKTNFQCKHEAHPDRLTLTFQLTTSGVLALEQARRKARRFNNYDNYGSDGPDY